MKDYDETLKQHLSQDAKQVQDLASKHLSEQNLSADLMAQLESVEQVSNEVQRKKTPWLLPASVAASVCLAVLLWQNNQSQPVEHSQMVIGKKQATLSLQISQLPSNLENKTNQRLQKEQQAILTDLKSLKDRWLNI